MKILTPLYQLTFLLLIGLAAAGCSDDDDSGPAYSGSSRSSTSSSSSSSGEGTVSVSGTVVDGYVRGATVTVYDVSGLGGPAYLATGTTDGNGDFELALDPDSLPGYLAMISKGGIDIDTGLPAPSLALSLNSDAGRFNVTPLTDALVRRSLRAGSGFTDARGELAAELNVTVPDLYADPLDASHTAHAELQAGLQRALAGGEHSVVPADGDYRLSLVYLDKNDIGAVFNGLSDVTASNHLAGRLTLSDGEVSGTLDGGDTITGRIHGPHAVLSAEYPGGDGLTRVAGILGLFGSLSGTYVDYDDSGATPALSTGVFVASLIPETGVNADGLKAVARRIYAGNRNALFRDLFGDRDLAWGNMDGVTLDTDAYTIAANSFDIVLNAAQGETGHATDSIAFQEGTLLTLDLDGQTVPSGLAMMRFQDSQNDYAYFIQALGNRRGVYVAGCGSASNNTDCDMTTTGEAYAIGEAYLARRDTLIPTAEAGVALTVTMTAVTPHMLGQPRQPASFFETLDGWPMPAMTDSRGASGSAFEAGGVNVVSASLYGMKNASAGTAADEIDHADDYMLVAEGTSTGAIQGDRVAGGTVALLGVDAADWPTPFAGFAAPAAADTQLLTLGDAAFEFLVRPVYIVDPATDQVSPLEDYRVAYISGNVQVNEDVATLSFLSSDGESGTAELTLENRGGIYHMHGALEGEYIDLFYPAGGTRGVVVASDAADGSGDVYEIGEAFLTY